MLRVLPLTMFLAKQFCLGIVKLATHETSFVCGKKTRNFAFQLSAAVLQDKLDVFVARITGSLTG